MPPESTPPSGWVIDLDGVVWRGSAPIDGAAAAVDRLEAHGERVLFCTNNSNTTLGGYVEKLAAHGIVADGSVVSSATAAGQLVAPGERVMVCGGPGVIEAVGGRGGVAVSPGDRTAGDVDVVMVGFHREFDYAVMDRAMTALLAGARLVATNSDPRFPTETGFAPGCGSLVAAIETAAGVTATVAGKPHRPMADLVRERIGRGVVVGDSPGTDGALAAELGWPFGLVLTGNTSAAAVPPTSQERWVAPDLSTLVDRWLDGELEASAR